MPLVRVEVRNEYGLGLPELYKEANKEDPKAVLDGVAVAGLVGILRQLGDLAEFAAEVFHGLQEEVMNTSSRSHKLMLRARHIETALPPLEKAVLSQKSHLHFAYTTGSNWCARVKTEHHHFIYSDLPQFLMDSYEESRGPPRLHLLDKFDPGGPGSCLKRYSDPSFFRRASRSDETKAEKVLRYKKARKIKKKRSWKRKEEESNAARASFNGRTQFASRDCDGQTSPSQTVSTHGATLKSETGGRSNSFDSKTESGYIECVFHPTNSIEPEEHESKEPSPSRSNTDTHNDNLLLDYEIRSNLSPEEICQTSSCVTWDEKTEILHLSGQQSDNEDISDMSPPMNFVLVSQEREVVNAVDHESASTSVSFANQIDDVESELDQFMDALNTIESESETDIDFKTNQETEQGLNLVEDGTLSLSVEHSDQNQLVFEFQAEDNSGSSRISSPAADNQITIHPDTFLNKEMSEEIHNPDIVAERSLNFTSSLENEINVESVDGNVSFSGSVDDHSLAPVNNGNPVHEGLTNVRNLTPVQRGCFQDLNPEPSGHNGTTVPLAPMNDEIKRTPCEPTGPVKFWTNGGLLGLEPSKPPDFSPLNSMRQDSVANPTRQSNVASSEIKKGEYSDYIWKTSSRISPAKIEKPHFNHSQGQGMADQENDSKGSSRIFELGNRFLVNGLGQKTSCSEEPVIYQTKDMFGRKSSYTSPSSSPPLEHMKLSFQPMERYETSKMKLKFPDESNGDTFRSFQLVPDPALPPRDIGSDSDDDDDTFCRSSPYMSDDCLSPSNSEQWESGESPNSNDFEIYDALRRISLTESVLNQFSENGVENHLHDLPSFDEEFINISEPNPVPPPLPPMEWRATKSILDTVAENQEAASETLNYALNVKLSGSTISQQPKPALLKRDGDIEPECTVKTKQPDWEKSNGLKEANQSASGKGMDEKEDFLHQIRTKSFNLRRTATARPPVTPNPTASAKVTAILEKANAIRQAVGSDDGEDEDTWSNT